MTHINKNLEDQCEYLRNLVQRCACETNKSNNVMQKEKSFIDKNNL